MSASDFPVALFRLPFRPLFLLSGILSMLAIGAWGMFWFSPVPFSPFGGIYWWHGHEMVFGFAGAVLVGFLLTAARTWTGLPGMSGIPLIIITLCWLGARVMIALGTAESVAWILVLTTAYWGLAAFWFGRMIVTARMWRNIVLVPVLLLMGVLDLASSIAVQSGGNYTAHLHSGVLIMVLALTIVGGRVLPFFTSSFSGTEMIQPRQWIEWPLVILTIGLFFWNLGTGVTGVSVSLGVILLLTAGLHLVRFLRWDLKTALSSSMLWSLYLAYLFLILGLALMSGYHFGLVENLSTAFHAITIGAIGGMILSMTSRVSLGHTGRKIEAGRWLPVSFLLLFSAALVRVAGPLLVDAAWWPMAYHVSACLWFVSYAIWTLKFLPVLIRPRADGKPG